MKSRSRGGVHVGMWACGMVVARLLLGLGSQARAQTLRFDGYRERKVPEYATIKLGPFYSDVVLNQSIGWRYSRSEGDSVGITDGFNSGEIKEDGSDFPIVTSLTFKNYLLLSRNADLELSVRMQYIYFPMNTQDDEFNIDFTEEGIYAGLSTELEFSPVARMRIYDQFAYYTDWLDVRGTSDPYGGNRYERIVNVLGLDASWLASKVDSINLGLSREDEIPMSGSDEQFDTQEHFLYRQELSWEHRQNAFAVWRLGAEQAQTFYTHPDRDETIYWWKFFWGIDLKLTEFTELDFEIGYNIAKNEIETDSGGSFALGARGRLTERVSHQLRASRRFDNAFEGGVEVRDAARYQIDWVRMLLPGNVYILYSGSAPKLDALWSNYADLGIGTALSIPLTRRTAARFISNYTIRNNGTLSEETPPEEVVNPTTESDYATWVTGLSMGVRVRKKVSISGYLQHIERYSDNESLAYKRNIIGLSLNWAHRF